MRLLILFLVILFSLGFCQSQTFPEATLVNMSAINNSFPFSGDIYNGFITIDQASQSNLFYFLFAQNASNGTINNTAPVLIWLQGGPGSSTDWGCFNFIGPIIIANGSRPYLIENFYSWNQFANVLCIDNPTGVGFSQAFNGFAPNNSMESGQQLVNFMTRFYQIYPSLATNPLYIFGESYAGHYIPAFASILVSNASLSYIPLAGVGIGDGWVDPLRQNPFYATFGYASSLLDEKSRDIVMQVAVQSIITFYADDLEDSTEDSNEAIDDFATDGGDVNIDNYREYADDEAIDTTGYQTWLNNSQIQTLLGIPNMPYSGSNDTVYDDYLDDVAEQYDSQLATVLESGLPVLIYVGQDDANCGYEGVLDFVNVLNWTQITNFRKSKRSPWVLNGNVVGAVKQYANLQFVLINKAGHMTPLYQPEVSNEMTRRFLQGLPFNTPCNDCEGFLN